MPEIERILVECVHEDCRTLIDLFIPFQNLPKLARFLTLCQEHQLLLNRRSAQAYVLCGPQGLLKVVILGKSCDTGKYYNNNNILISVKSVLCPRSTPGSVSLLNLIVRILKR